MKKVLLIAGGGTLGTNVARELLQKGDVDIDIIALEERIGLPESERLNFYKANATIDYLKEFLRDRRYDAIVNFLHFSNAELYAPYYELTSKKTDQLVLLSSYRIYADEQHPVTEDAPQLIDTVKDDEDFIQNEKYALGKSKCERFLRSSGDGNWTIIRPVISFTNLRFDIVCNSGRRVIAAAKEQKKLNVPESSRNLTAGLDWAGNSGKIIANLLFKPETLGEAYTVSSGQNMKWGEIADIYTELLGVGFEWVDDASYSAQLISESGKDWMFRYDRAFDRCIDASKVLRAAGLCKEDFTGIREGIEYELRSIGAIV